MCPGHFRHRQAVVLANSLESSDVLELVLGSCPHLPEEAGFPDSAIVPGQSLGIVGVFSRGHLGQVDGFSTKLSVPHTGHGPSWQQA